MRNVLAKVPLSIAAYVGIVISSLPSTCQGGKGLSWVSFNKIGQLGCETCNIKRCIIAFAWRPSVGWLVFRDSVDGNTTRRMHVCGMEWIA